MKKLICVLLVLVMTLSLCACAKNGDNKNPAGGETTTVPVETGNETTAPEETTVPETEATVPTETEPVVTEHEHKYTEEVTKKATCSAKGVKTYTCDCGDSYTKDIKKLDHTYSKATCTQAKTCSVCGKTDGKAASHTYVSGKCSVCGAAQKNYKKLTDGRWRAYAVCSEDEMEKLVFFFKEDNSGAFSVSIYNPESMMVDAECVEIDGKKWYEAGFGYGSDEMSYTEEGSKITVKINARGTQSTVVLERTAGNKLKVKSVSGTIIDSMITDAVKGRVFENVG